MLSISRRLGVLGAKILSKQTVVITSTQPHRWLYSNLELGVTDYLYKRQKVADALPDPDAIKKKLKLLDPNEVTITVLENHLKNLLHIMTNEADDVALLLQILHTLIAKRANYVGDQYRFDTIILRMFHHFNMADEAMRFFEDPALQPIFKTITSYQILLDLLYENARYADLLRLYDQLIATKRMTPSKQIDAILMATYYRMDTAEALEAALALWHAIVETDRKKTRKSQVFVAALALNRNQPATALELLDQGNSRDEETFYVTARQVRMMAWMRLGHFDNIIEWMKIMLKKRRAYSKFVPATSAEVLDAIEGGLADSGTPEQRTVFSALRKEFAKNEFVIDTTLHELLCQPFQMRLPSKMHHKLSSF